MSNSLKILFNLSGSIAAYKACDVISKLVKAGHQVQVACTPSTFEFVGAATLEGLTGRKVLSETFAAGEAMGHIEWARWADVAILCPASANTIAKFANGLADDLVSTLFLAWEPHKPYLLAPAMNSVMFANVATQENLKKLSQRGLKVLDTAEGPLACGEFGKGRLLEPEEIVAAILGQKTSKGKLLVTYGGTREPIDSVRFISNMSTGKTGAALADSLSQLGWDVEVLRAKDSAPSLKVQTQTEFVSFDSLDQQLKQKLDSQAWTAVIHAAAVSDFSVKSISQGQKTVDSSKKLNSDEGLTIELKPNHKILSQLKKYASPNPIQVIGFKLTNTPSTLEREAAVAKLLDSQVDLAIHNDLTEVFSEGSQRTFTLTQKNKPTQNSKAKGLTDLALQLDQFLTGGHL